MVQHFKLILDTTKYIDSLLWGKRYFKHIPSCVSSHLLGTESESAIFQLFCFSHSRNENLLRLTLAKKEGFVCIYTALSLIVFFEGKESGKRTAKKGCEGRNKHRVADYSNQEKAANDSGK